ncbi:unnamed protein product [Diamesa serratosioi]
MKVVTVFCLFIASVYGQYDPIANLLGLPVGMGSPGLLAVRGPIYVDGSSLSPVNPGYSQMESSQVLQPQVGVYSQSPYNTYNPQMPVQYMYDENIEPTSRRTTLNANSQSEIQQIGYGNMNLQGNIQQATGGRWNPADKASAASGIPNHQLADTGVAQGSLPQSQYPQAAEAWNPNQGPQSQGKGQQAQGSQAQGSGYQLQGPQAQKAGNQRQGYQEQGAGQQNQGSQAQGLGKQRQGSQAQGAALQRQPSQAQGLEEQGLGSSEPASLYDEMYYKDSVIQPMYDDMYYKDIAMNPQHYRDNSIKPIPMMNGNGNLMMDELNDPMADNSNMMNDPMMDDVSNSMMDEMQKPLMDAIENPMMDEMSSPMMDELQKPAMDEMSTKKMGSMYSPLMEHNYLPNMEQNYNQLMNPTLMQNDENASQNLSDDSPSSKEEESLSRANNLPLLFQCDKILSKDEQSRDKSLSMLKNLILDPVKRNDCRILPIMLIVLKKHKNNSTDITLKILEILDIIATDLYSALKMIKNNFLMSFLFESMKQNQVLSTNAAQLLNSLSDHSEVVDKLVFDNVCLVEKLKDLINVFESKDLYEALAKMITRHPNEFVIQDFITLLHERLYRSKEYRAVILKCIALMINCDKGQEIADKSKLVLNLVCLLMNEYDEEIITNTILTLKNCLISSNSKWQCESSWHKICLVLIAKTFTKNNVLMQIYSIQALRILSDMPIMKDFLNKRCKQKIKQITPLSLEAEYMKADFMKWLKYKNYKEFGTAEHQYPKINVLPFEYLNA